MKSFGFKNLMIFIVLSATVGLAYLLPFLRYTFYDQMLAALQITDTQSGFLITVFGFAAMPCYLIGGFLANRFTTRTLYIVTLIGLAVTTIWYAFATDFTQLIIIFGLYALFGSATMWEAYLTGIRKLGNPKNQSKLFGSSEATRGIVQSLLGFAFVAVMGIAATPAIGFRNVLLLGAAVAIVLLILTLIFFPKDEKKGGAEVAEAAESAEGEALAQAESKVKFKDVITCSGVWLAILLVTGGYLAWTIGNNYVTTYTVRVVGIDEELASTIGIIRSYIIVVLGGFIGGWILDKFHYKGVGIAVMLAIVIACFIGIVFSNAVIPLCVALTLVLAFVNNILKSTMWSTLGQTGIPVEMTPLATGIISVIAFFPADIVCPAIGGIWIDEGIAAGDITLGFNKLFIMAIVFAILSIIGGILTMRRTKKLESEGKIL
ncbi:MAG TPA: MFS transporter [Eggerthellaceae bacterium]|nr:MFS transporter [Eggerthellaceae bacterium]